MAPPKENVQDQIKDADNVTKYKAAAEVVKVVLKEVVDMCKEGCSVVEICAVGDSRVNEEAQKVYKKGYTDEESGKTKQIPRGVAFPVCITLNEMVCHYSPLRSDEGVTLKDGDVVKIDMGAHVDGFMALAGTTIVVGADATSPVTGPAADVIMAAYNASEAVLRTIKAEKTNFDCTELIDQVAEEYGVKAVTGMVSYQISKNEIAGAEAKVIPQAPDAERRAQTKKAEFEVGDVFAIDIIMSTGDGKPVEKGGRTTVFKKTNTRFTLRMATSRAVYSEISNNFTTMPFSLRACTDEKKARMGIVECQKQGLVESYPVMSDKEGALVAQFKYTVMLTSNGVVRLTPSIFDAESVKSEKSIEKEELKALLAEEMEVKKKKTNKKKKPKAKTATTEA
ncbi:hypothetical protein SARC_07436 [Sphaeroforma arctica JP610]|uniref:Peptidase M24 domain-containing protein n=1 Tax=Sphaeroforma arctica JP610 TaxID=667725 RepID=A0A0L0FW69_9EUKA|nr:hypothetical protein SARC_07436 [Sphaeroforma arctica JP610]KNC80193.1 hypothetical protein SARC_07436 [Sphaeroforma arctica JP610]|eukprot:XP_014154095.1 hypothetical protein SARC_07436 [Sphaeroforma arctica JP610]